MRKWMCPVAAAAVACSLCIDAPAATLYWDPDANPALNNTTTGANLGGSGTWDASPPAPTRWYDGVAETTWSPGADAVFFGAVAGTISVASPQSVNSLTFKTNGYNVTGGALDISAATTANFSADAGVTATISSVIAGSATMTKLGPGTLVLAGTNTNTATTTGGGWRIDGGTLRISSDQNLGAPLPDAARNTVTDIQFNQSTIQADASFDLNINRRTKVNTNSATNLGDAIIDTHGNALRWFGSIQGGVGSIRVINTGPNPGILILGTDKVASINPFGSALPAGAVNLTVDGAIVQTSGTVTPTGGELGSETGAGGAGLAIKLDNAGQIRAESGDYTFQRNLILGPGGGSLDTGAWIHTFAGGTISGAGALAKFGTGTLVIDNPIATWAGGTFVHIGTLQLGRGGSNGLLPGVLGGPSNVVIDAGATLRFNRGSNKSFFDNISGGGSVVIANSPTATVRLVSDNTYTGGTTITSGTLMIGQGNPGQPGSIVGSVLNNATLSFNRVEDSSFAGSISGSGVVNKQAAGKLVLSGAHTYSGATNVLQGKLVINGSLGGTAVNVAGGAALAGSGAIGGTVTLAAGNTAAAQGAIDLRDGSLATLLLDDLNSTDTVFTIGGGSADLASLLAFEVGASADCIQIASGKLLVNAGGGIVNIAPLSGFGPGTYDLIRFPAGQAGGLSNLTLSNVGLPPGFAYQLQTTPTAEQLVVTPEPGGLALLGFAAMTTVRRRRRGRLV